MQEVLCMADQDAMDVQLRKPVDMQHMHLSLLTAAVPPANLAEQLCARFQHLDQLLEIAKNRWTSLQADLLDRLKILAAYCDANFAFVRELEQMSLPQLSGMVSSRCCSRRCALYVRNPAVCAEGATVKTQVSDAL